MNCGVFGVFGFLGFWVFGFLGFWVFGFWVLGSLVFGFGLFFEVWGLGFGVWGLGSGVFRVGIKVVGYNIFRSRRYESVWLDLVYSWYECYSYYKNNENTKNHSHSLGRL